ncbi:tannase/feruloyl esterase family alpha/beta hydrolase [Actinocrispum sp. NPDC049592]|uniref:tannase/feruloyl esterase family alpha/beta hydrolase n=1 Tax=Actinocrispum sp. NPDC049592 TaxID=3154835 RepID=UPI0034300139
MKISTKLLTAAVPLALLIPLTAAAASSQTGPQQQVTCASVPLTAPQGAKIESMQAVQQPGGTVSFPATPLSPAITLTDVPAYCEITVALTHSGANDHVKVALTLPDTGWSGRLQATGGSAYTAAGFGAPMVQAVKDGYAAVSTDAGVPLTGLDTTWGLTADGRTNQPLLTNFATRSVHEAAVIGKEVTRKHFHREVSYAYWNGCSTGGRQGYAEAQNYPDDFDGILAVAPAVNWTQFAVATLWPQTVMNQDHHFVGNCVLGEFQKAAVKACDANDGVTNGIIDYPDECGYDPRRLVGTKILCDGKEITVTAADADVMRKIWAGPTDERGRSLWAGLPKGADFGWLAGTQADPSGNLFAPGFPVAVHWVQTFLERDPAFDTSKITYQQFRELFRQSVREYDDVIGTSDANLWDFRRAGGKLLSFEGTADQLIPPGGTLQYRQDVERRMGGAGRVNDFYRLFLAPGAQHCSDATGLVPTNPLGALVDWVEHGKAPATLAAASKDGSANRDLCPLPQLSRYSGHGDPKAASSYRCR